MTPPRGRAQHTAAGLGLLAAVALACAAPPPAAGDADALERAARALKPPAPPGELRVRLVFGGEADLDLYVTDPLQETVYFANSPTAAGGILDADRRCDSDAPRVETVRFRHPPRGRYRVGVDFPEACEKGVEAAAFVVTIESQGGVRSARGRVVPLEFRAVVVEFDH